MLAGKAKGFCSTTSKRCHSLSPVSDPWGLGLAWLHVMAMGRKFLTARHVSGQRLQSWKKQDMHLSTNGRVLPALCLTSDRAMSLCVK